MRFKNKVVIITGASSGIGEAFARAFHREGAVVHLVARRQAKLEAIASELQERVQVTVADLSVAADRDKLAKRLASEPVDILVNNAGRGSFGFFETISVEQEEEMIHLNMIAPMVLSHAVIPQMKMKQHGAIVFVSSIAAFQPLPLMATYAATKAGNYMHGRALAAELKQFGVKVLTVCPGPVATEFGGVARVPGTMTNLSRNEAVDVVTESLTALAQGSELVVPCLRAKIMVLGSILVPKWISTKIVLRALKKALQ